METDDEAGGEGETLAEAPRKEEPKGRGQREDRQTEGEGGEQRRDWRQVGARRKGHMAIVGGGGVTHPHIHTHPSHPPVNREEGLGSVAQRWCL